MRIQALVRFWMALGWSALGVTTFGGGSTPSPGRNQEWLTVDEFTKRWPNEDLDRIPRPWPVLILEKGSELALRLKRSTVGVLDLEEDAAMTLKVKKTLYNNLENFTASNDKITWSSMEGMLWPLRSVTFSLQAREGRSEIAVHLRGSD
jgi:hypothetical protein